MNGVERDRHTDTDRETHRHGESSGSGWGHNIGDRRETLQPQSPSLFLYWDRPPVSEEGRRWRSSCVSCRHTAEQHRSAHGRGQKGSECVEMVSPCCSGLMLPVSHRPP